MDRSNNFIPLWRYAELKHRKYQTIYRWYRQHQFLPEDAKKEKREVERIMIRANAEKII